jgi:phosphotransferase system enzyme I (PtsI)
MRSRPEKVLRGLAASPGIAIGEVYVVNRSDPSVAARMIEESEVGSEVERFRQAIEQAKTELVELKKRLQDSLPRRADSRSR